MNNALYGVPQWVLRTRLNPIIKSPRSSPVQAPFTEPTRSFRAGYMQSGLSCKKNSARERVISPDVPRKPPNPLPGRRWTLVRRDVTVHWPTLDHFASVKNTSCLVRFGRPLNGHLSDWARLA